jgi:hypothetical protein
VLEARHEYGGSYGGRYCFVKTWPGMSASKLERSIIRAFIYEHHAAPVANGGQSWGWVKKDFAR